MTFMPFSDCPILTPTLIPTASPPPEKVTMAVNGIGPRAVPNGQRAHHGIFTLHGNGTGNTTRTKWKV